MFYRFAYVKPITKQMKKPKLCITLWQNTPDIWEHSRNEENSRLRQVFSTFSLCSQMPVVFYYRRSTVKRERFFAQVYFSNETLSQTTVSTGRMKMFRLEHETMNVCLRNVVRFVHAECGFDKIKDILLLACTCEKTCESVWPPNVSLYSSSTCVHLRQLAGLFGQGANVVNKFSQAVDSKN